MEKKRELSRVLERFPDYDFDGGCTNRFNI